MQAAFSQCVTNRENWPWEKKQLWKMLQITSQLTSIIMAVMMTVEVVVILQIGIIYLYFITLQCR